MIEQIRPTEWAPQTISVPVSKEVLEKFGSQDTAVIKRGAIEWQMNNTMEYQGVKGIRIQDILALEILKNNLWTRPIYFSVTCTEDSKIGAGEYMQMEGMAMRMVPQKRQPGIEFVNEPVLRKQLYEENVEPSLTYKPGFKFRGLNDSTIFFDENHERLVQNYRNSFIRLALYYQNTNQGEKCAATLDLMEKKIPRKIIKLDYRLLYDIGDLYLSSGKKARFDEITIEVEKEALVKLEENPQDVQGYYNPYRLLLNVYEKRKEWDKAIGIMNRLQTYYPNDQSLKQQIEQYKQNKIGIVPAAQPGDTVYK
jgi:tetratricopeptide (TPR) repeat protein